MVLWADAKRSAGGVKGEKNVTSKGQKLAVRKRVKNYQKLLAAWRIARKCSSAQAQRPQAGGERRHFNFFTRRRALKVFSGCVGKHNGAANDSRALIKNVSRVSAGCRKIQR